MSTINQRIIAAVTPVVLTCVPDIYQPNTGEEVSTYCTFNYSELPDDFGDDAPGAMRYLVQVHLYAPWKTGDGESNDTMATRKALRRALFAAGFTYPSVENSSDESYQHFVFEFEDFDGEV